MMSANNDLLKYVRFVTLKFRNSEASKSLILLPLYTAIFSLKKQIMFFTMHKFLFVPRDKITFFGIN